MGPIPPRRRAWGGHRSGRLGWRRDTPRQPTEAPLTEEGWPLAERLAKAGAGDVLRGVAEAVLRMPMEAGVEGLTGAGRLEANDEWQMRRRPMGVEAMGEMPGPPPANETPRLPPRAA